MKRHLYIMLLLLTTLNLYTAFAHGRTQPEKTLIVEKIVVQPGDTLWKIAQKNGSPKIDIREHIYEIQKINNMEGSLISPGDTILVPVKQQ